MRADIQSLRAAVEADLAAAATPAALEDFRITYLARKGRIAALFDRLRELAPGERPEAGKDLNALRQTVEALFAERTAALAAPARTRDLPDLTMPGRRHLHGSLHPLLATMEEITEIFVSMGFGIADGPEIEDDEHNFTALNFPPDHPARDMQDTFFVEGNALLRTHTSPVQIRVMRSTPPPVRVIMPGRVYRNEAVSARSLCLFHQVEGLYVDRGVTFAELKGTLVAFAERFFGAGLRYKFRPTYFPFTEPSADIYISCFICGGGGCRMCKHAGWLEILGCGMVDPNVLRNVGYDPEEVSGFAFGLGIERITALRTGIDDLRTLYDNDLRLLEQF
jgi:phenylalanyl-tRNA synthetase alpha chain